MTDEKWYTQPSTTPLGDLEQRARDLDPELVKHIEQRAGLGWTHEDHFRWTSLIHMHLNIPRGDEERLRAVARRLQERSPSYSFIMRDRFDRERRAALTRALTAQAWAVACALYNWGDESAPPTGRAHAIQMFTGYVADLPAPVDLAREILGDG